MKQTLLAAALALFVGCSKKTATEAPTPSTPPTAATGETAAADHTATLNRLTQVLRRFSAEHQRVPKSLDELVTAGYLTEIPAAPPGKKFVFDDQLRVRIE